MASLVTYSQIRITRDREIRHVSSNAARLNLFHDEIIRQTVAVAINRIKEEAGPPPSPFSFFVMGSAGRLEQGIWSDQDHGIVYMEGPAETKQYFLMLGSEISEGLLQTGYKKCDGKVMGSNPMWCRSLGEWEKQLEDWILEASWESIRYLLTFLDGRSLHGETSFISKLKLLAYDSIHKERLLIRILQNTMHVRKGVGVLGQFLVETHGPYTGMLNIKDTALFPYVNGARLLAIHERILDTSTLLRLQQLPDSLMPPHEREKLIQSFINLQNYRLLFSNHTDYESGHYLAVDRLSKQQRKVLKEGLKDGIHLYEYVRNLVEKEDRNGHE